MMNDIEKYDYIEEIYGSSYFDNTDIILDLLSDSDECVRLEMIEACYACKQELVQEKLLQMLKTTTGLEKGYLLLTLSYIYQDHEEKIIDYLKKNIHSVDEYERMDAYAGLIILGYACYLEEFLKFLNSSEYYIRCATLNMLSELIKNDLIKKEDIITIRNVVSQVDKQEKIRAVKSSIQHLLGVINQAIKEK